MSVIFVGLKPGADTVTTYPEAGGREGAANRPASVAVTFRSMPRLALETSISALETAAPPGSTTLPLSAPRPASDCAHATRATHTRKRQQSTMETAKSRHTRMPRRLRTGIGRTLTEV